MSRFRIQHRIFPGLPIDSIGNPLKLQKYHPPYHVIEKSIRFYFKCDLWEYTDLLIHLIAHALSGVFAPLHAAEHVVVDHKAALVADHLGVG